MLTCRFCIHTQSVDRGEGALISGETTEAKGCFHVYSAPIIKKISFNELKWRKRKKFFRFFLGCMYTASCRCVHRSGLRAYNSTFPRFALNCCFPVHSQYFFNFLMYKTKFRARAKAAPSSLCWVLLLYRPASMIAAVPDSLRESSTKIAWNLAFFTYFYLQAF